MSQPPLPGGSAVVPPALDLLPDGIVLLDREGRCRYLNAHARRVADHAGRAALGQPCWDVFPQVRDGSVRALIARVLENWVPASLAAAQVTSPGAGGHWVEVTVVPEPATGGALVQWHDVTARVRGEQWARTQADLLRRVAEDEPLLSILERLCQAIERKLPGSLASVLLLDEERRTLHPAAAPSLPSGFVAQTAGLPVAPDVGSCGTAAHRGEPVVVADIASDSRWAEGRAPALAAGLRACWSVPICGAASAAEAWTALEEGSGATAAAAARVLGTFAVYYREPREPTAVDLMFVEEAAHLASVAITRERRERALQRVEARLAFALDAARLGTWHWDAATNRTQWSEGMGPLFGRPRGTPAPATERLLDPVLPDDRPRFEDAVRAALGGDSEIEIEFRVIWPDGTVHWLLDRGRVTRDAAGRPRHMDGVVVDITERKAAEHALVEREKQLQHARRLEAIGRLAGGVAHDFNNLLTVIQHSDTFALEALPSGHPASAEVREIARATTHATALTRQLLAFGRRQLLRPEVVDLRRVVGDVVPLVRRLVGGHVDVRLTVDEAGPALVHADSSQLTEVLLNLAANARDAMGPSGGSVTISLGRSRLDRDSVKALCAPMEEPLPEGRYVTLAVRDTGSGMDEETRAQIFEPFFTTKAFGQGAGLGLATVHGIVRQMGGAITVDSSPGAGSTFTIYLPERVTIPSDSSPGLARLPRSDSPLTVGSAHPATSEEGAPTVPRVERPRALLAEDEEAVRRVMARMLERLGYDVIEAADGAAALAQLVETARPWALLVSDVLMPHLDGLALANRARRRFPALPIVLLSGYGAEALTGSDDLPRGVRLLRKPVSVEEFRAAVEHAVSAVGGPAPNGEVPTDG